MTPLKPAETIAICQAHDEWLESDTADDEPCDVFDEHSREQLWDYALFTRDAVPFLLELKRRLEDEIAHFTPMFGDLENLLLLVDQEKAEP